MTDLPPPFPGPLAVERSALRTPDDVDRMLQLHALGWGVKRIARELGCAKNTVKQYVTQGDWRPAAPVVRVGVLDALQPWLAACFHQHHGNADVVRQALRRETSSPCRSGRSSGRWRRSAKRCAPPRAPRCALKRDRASNSRSISASAPW